ncbi:MAG TPA: tetratricopeptide repeat protein, partial [Candidatus Latescibacteria bacterium]|nr:tetratricopeptide repeat protein [Candidatus Latescibacterota bacterium]
YQNLGRFDQAEQALQQALLLPGEHPEAVVNLQILQMRRGGQDPLEIYQALTRDFPERAELWRGLAAEYAARGRLDEAIEVCRLILSLVPDDRQALRNLEKLLKNQRGN